MKAFVNAYNRLTWLRNICAELSKRGCEVIIIDNLSTYEPLLQWYKHCPYIVHRCTSNYGRLALWKSGVVNQFTDRHYIYTDHDLDISNVPLDMIAALLEGLSRFPDVIKCGLSLSTEDLPPSKFKNQEQIFWSNPDADGYCKQFVDTTLALYDRERFPEAMRLEEDLGLKKNKFYSAVRMPKPYTARHLPSYHPSDYTPEVLAEEIYYRNNPMRIKYQYC